MTNPNFTRTSAAYWCRQNADDHADECGDVNSTTLAEACAAHYGVDAIGGPLDDPDHWIWEVALID